MADQFKPRCIKGILIILLVVAFSNSSNSQSINIEKDLKFIASTSEQHSHFHKREYIYKNESRFWVKYNPVKMVFGGLLYLYQNVISKQFSATCLYEPSCSEFSKNAIAEYGLIKGIFLTTDRLTRCNKIAATDIHPLSIDEHTHKSSDPVKNYQ